MSELKRWRLELKTAWLDLGFPDVFRGGSLDAEPVDSIRGLSPSLRAKVRIVGERFPGNVLRDPQDQLPARATRSRHRMPGRQTRWFGFRR